MDDEMLFRSVTAQTTPREDERVKAWLAESESNASRYGDVINVLRLCDDAEHDLAFGPPPHADDLLARSRRSTIVRARGAAWKRFFLAAAALAAIVVTVQLARGRWPFEQAAEPRFSSAEFVTELEPATVGLRDGSIVRLAGDSRLRVHDRPFSREVSLIGRGYFAVTSDPSAPFTIRSDVGTVTVLGTRFDLTVDDENLRLVVIEGRVRLTIRGSAVEVRAGQMAQVLKGNLVPPIDVPDPESILDWVGNFTVFQNTPLRSVAAEVERRHGVRIEFSQPALGDRTITAFFAGRSLDEIAEVICVVANLECVTVDNVLRMSAAR